MATTGYGNYWDKTKWYSECPKCHKKGLKQRSLMDNDGTIRVWKACMYCDYWEDIE